MQATTRALHFGPCLHCLHCPTLHHEPKKSKTRHGKQTWYGAFFGNFAERRRIRIRRCRRRIPKMHANTHTLHNAHFLRNPVRKRTRTAHVARQIHRRKKV
jgi:hypothetical protein